MELSLDEICEELGIKEIAPSEWKRGRRDTSSIFEGTKFSDEEQARRFNGYALPQLRALAPPICERLAGVRKVAHFLYGTGLELIYYAANHPETEFVACDNDSRAEGVTSERLKRFGVRNVELRREDAFAIDPCNWRANVVIAMDLPHEVPLRFRGQLSFKEFKQGAPLWFAQLVDSSSRPSFLVMSHYGPWSRQQGDGLLRVLSTTGINRLEQLGFEYKKREEPKMRGAILFGVKE